MITPQEFIYWLQGALEISETKSLNENQTAAIREKLEDCFVKKTNVPPLVYGEPIKYCQSVTTGDQYPFTNDKIQTVTGIWPHHLLGDNLMPKGFTMDDYQNGSLNNTLNKETDLLSPPTFYTC